jgi:hypothetical protein
MAHNDTPQELVDQVKAALRDIRNSTVLEGLTAEQIQAARDAAVYLGSARRGTLEALHDDAAFKRAASRADLHKSVCLSFSLAVAGAAEGLSASQ